MFRQRLQSSVSPIFLLMRGYQTVDLDNGPIAAHIIPSCRLGPQDHHRHGDRRYDGHHRGHDNGLRHGFPCLLNLCPYSNFYRVWEPSRKYENVEFTFHDLYLGYHLCHGGDHHTHRDGVCDLGRDLLSHPDTCLGDDRGYGFVSGCGGEEREAIRRIITKCEALKVTLEMKGRDG